MKKLSFVDTAFLLSETRETPMHVAGVSLYTLPEGANEQEFLRGLEDNLRDLDTFLPPFGDRLKTGRLGLAGPAYWEPDPALDIDYHIRHSALPKPGRYRELFNLVSRLHGTLLERSRPLWEMHLIEGLQNRQFAVYSKTHHAAVDGARSMHVARCMLSADPDYRLPDSPMSLPAWERYRARLELSHPRALSDAEIRNVAEKLKQRLDTSAQVFDALKRFTLAWAGRGGSLALPFRDVPRSSINTPIEGARRFVAQSWPFARIRAVGKAFDGTFNDAVLAMCAGALRMYMQKHAELPTESLKALVPVSVRAQGDIDSGNAVAAISADLATNIKDPARRFVAIQDSVNAGKAFFDDMSAAEIQLVSMVMQAPSMVLMPLGLASRFPAVNTTISNVPGIQEPMYWNGARMDGSYPASIIMNGMALNITLVTYDKNVDFGITACRRSVPQAQRLIDYMEQSLLELEDAAGLIKPGPKTRPKTKAKPKAKAKAKARPKTKAKATAKAKPKAKPKTKAASPRKRSSAQK
ncbi:MAG: wax ester/triacylglycerol synthase family O-acyltransferase [Halieaceae bacterium]